MNNAIMLEATELDLLNGGSWGYNTYHNEKAYKDAGIKTEWTPWYNPFQTDKFYFKGKQITKDLAAKIVFFKHATGMNPSAWTFCDIVQYAENHKQEFETDIEEANY